MAWYKDWFNSPYYHILYGQHNDAEASLLIGNLANKLNFNSDKYALDLACGKGRHSKQLANFKMHVSGIDLSEESIKEARLSASSNLEFAVHDMRKVYKTMFFDYVFNIFTSFGYFADAHDNLKTLRAVRENLKPQGLFIQDYFNSEIVIQAFKPLHEIEAGGIHFKIKKEIKDHKIIKTIAFEDKSHDYQFCEFVDLFELSDFEKMYAQTGLKIQNVYGDYQLNPFIKSSSKRLIILSSPI